MLMKSVLILHYFVTEIYLKTCYLQTDWVSSLQATQYSVKKESQEKGMETDLPQTDRIGEG
jgi:hypothetical protein